ncbi:unnamed protein product [Fusarium graminearum]|uniref:Uncharacterized protein n=1 Tax=Gibberella zeae TaxID=5518 RepID=A0A4U9FBP4_GIBZA|nr:hypothetical protein HG531_006825 [Fusarium graminearum]CAF3461975.1 unnamed protein product [Fusarium graminearum]CAF3491039.1 unnamed protein product [Fusarium graminearum]CAF3581046.1 unnamed protein product [Fusarium graminearum]CAG1963434.1 unnamed protein product [Fusarium graminearum]
MRYEDWDVLLFEQNSTTPLQEFKVACYVVHDTAPGLPTVTCFVPSLEPGTPFQVSIHLWKNERIDQIVDNEKHSTINARLFIDGSLVSSAFAALDITWPYIVARTDTNDAIGFPVFQQELLCQPHWSAADNLGRIKIVISEGIYHGVQDDAFQRVRDHVVFSFQHAPRGQILILKAINVRTDSLAAVLEHLEIAWPNPSMWQRLQQSSTSSQTSSNSETKDQITMQSPYIFQGPASECNSICPGTPSFYLDNQPAYLTMSSWGHTVPPHNQDLTPHMSTPEFRFYKEDWPDSPMFADAMFASVHQTQQQVQQQQMYTPSNGSVPMPLVRLQTQSPAIHGSTKLGQRTAPNNPARLLFAPPAHNTQQTSQSDTIKRPAKRARANTPR